MYWHKITRIEGWDKERSYLYLFVFDLWFRAQDNYEIIKKIGRGKYSEVYEGINTLTNQRIVIKILKPGKYQDFSNLTDKDTT